MKITSILQLIFGVLGLIGVRVVEQHLFYDPFLHYFHEANKLALFPDFDWGKLILSHIFRFTLNLFFSAIILHALFRNKQWTIQGLVLMMIVFVITFPLYLYAVAQQFDFGYLFSFYIRRFVIQPIILLLIIPVFYYRKKLQA